MKSDRGNMWTYNPKVSAQSIQRKKTESKLDVK
jgi:hypothetical protein